MILLIDKNIQPAENFIDESLTNPIKVSVLSHEKKFMPDKESATCFVDSNIWLYAFIEGSVEAIRNGKTYISVRICLAP